jgi:N-dimethylarginine dimethylaminohydrolase
MKVWSWNEWDPLKSVIVGRAEGARVPMADRSLRAIHYAHLPQDAYVPSGPYPEQVIEEAQEDLEALCDIFRKQGVKVYRPDILDTAKVYQTLDFISDSQYVYCPRDSILVHGDMVIETPMPARSRYFENRAYHSLLSSAFDEGARWISAPKPVLSDDNYSLEAKPGIPTLLEKEICFDAANVLRCGRDLFYLVSNSGNKKGAQWLRSVLGPEFRVHNLEGIYSYMHLDSTIAFLRPGLVLLNPSRLNQKNLPEVLSKWDIIWCPEPQDIGYYPPYENASQWIGMNLMMIRPDLALVEKHQTNLIEALEKKGISVIPISMRHQRTLGGGAHCVTLDLHREGQLESYW